MYLFKVNNKDTRMKSHPRWSLLQKCLTAFSRNLFWQNLYLECDVFRCLSCKLKKAFTRCSGLSFVDPEHLNARCNDYFAKIHT